MSQLYSSLVLIVICATLVFVVINIPIPSKFKFVFVNVPLQPVRVETVPSYPVRHILSYPPVSVSPCMYNNKVAQEQIGNAAIPDIKQCVDNARLTYLLDPLQHTKRICSMNRKIYIQIIFNDEIGLLQLHIGELYHVVDYFIIVESSLTFSGGSKRLVFQENALLFNRWKDKIIYVNCDLQSAVFTSMSDTNRAWPRELYSRGCGMLGLATASDHDLVIVVDTDEILKPIFISALKMCSYHQYWEQDGGQMGACGKRYISNWKWLDKDYPIGCRPGIASVKTARSKQLLIRGEGIQMPDAHWHCSWCFFGDPVLMHSKLEKWAEQGETQATINNRNDMIALQTNCPTSPIRGYRCVLNIDYDSLPEIVKTNLYRFYPDFIPTPVPFVNETLYIKSKQNIHYWKSQSLVNANESMLIPSFSPIPLNPVVY